jgi:ABC-type microcin C transport system permease subunit YejE
MQSYVYINMLLYGMCIDVCVCVEMRIMWSYKYCDMLMDEPTDLKGIGDIMTYTKKNYHRFWLWITGLLQYGSSLIMWKGSHLIRKTL